MEPKGDVVPWIGIPWNRWEKEGEFLKRFAKYMGYSHERIAKELGRHKPDVTSAFGFSPRNQEVVREVIRFLGFKVEDGKLLLDRTVYFLSARQESSFSRWSPVIVDLLTYISRNYEKWRSNIVFLFSHKLTPFVVIRVEAEGKEFFFMIDSRKLRMPLSSFLLAHVYSSPMLEAWKRFQEKGNKILFSALPILGEEKWTLFEDMIKNQKEAEAEKILSSIFVAFCLTYLPVSVPVKF